MTTTETTMTTETELIDSFIGRERAEFRLETVSIMIKKDRSGFWEPKGPIDDGSLLIPMKWWRVIVRADGYTQRWAEGPSEQQARIYFEQIRKEERGE